MWDSVDFGFRVFGDVGVGNNGFVNGLGNYGCGYDGFGIHGIGE